MVCIVCYDKHNLKVHSYYNLLPGSVAQSVLSLTADPGVGSLILAWSHTFVEIDHEIILSHSPPSAESRRGCCQIQVKVCVQSSGYPLSQACPGKSMVR